MTESAIHLEGIEKSYKLYQSPLARFKEALHPRKKRYCEDFFALKGIDLDIPKGQTWGIIGLNGSGKSTLLKTICGVIQPDRGFMEVNGRIAALLELGSGFNPEYTGRQNVFFSGALADVSRTGMEELFTEIEAFAEIGDFIDQPVKSYSSGMLMRLAFAVAVHVSPDIFVVDEALAVGDARFQHKCMNKILSFKGRSTMLLVTHDMSAVLTLCDRVVWLHEGSLQDIGDPKRIVDKYTQAFYEGSSAEKVEPSTDDKSKFSPPVISGGHATEALAAEAATVVTPEASSFGSGLVTFTQVALLSVERGPVTAVYGGEEVILYTWLESQQEISCPIISFGVKNLFGVEIFGFNNLILGAEIPSLVSGSRTLAKFEFIWPRIAVDHYALSVSVTEGDLEQHITHHWVHDILIVNVMSTHKYHFGLVSVEQAKMEVRPLSG